MSARSFVVESRFSKLLNITTTLGLAMVEGSGRPLKYDNVTSLPPRVSVEDEKADEPPKLENLFC